MFILILSSVILLEFTNTSIIPESVYKIVLSNSTSVYIKPRSEQITLPSLPSVDTQINAERTVRRGKLACQVNNSSRKMQSLGKSRKMDCDPTKALLRVFMYDLPPEFHFGLLGWKGSRSKHGLMSVAQVESHHTQVD